MNILCKTSNMASDVRCAVCGQGFLVYWTQSSPAERAQQYATVVGVLRRHHIAMNGECAHPAGEFCLPMFDVQAREAHWMFPAAAQVAA